MKALLVSVFLMGAFAVQAISFDCNGEGYRVLITDTRDMEVTGNGLNLNLQNVFVRHFFDIEYYANVGREGIDSVTLKINEELKAKFIIEKRYSTKNIQMKCTRN